MNNRDGTTFYSKRYNGSSADSFKPKFNMVIMEKLQRRSLHFMIQQLGSTIPSFMTIYDNKARPNIDELTHNKTENEGQYYNPAYTIGEVGNFHKTHLMVKSKVWTYWVKISKCSRNLLHF